MSRRDAQPALKNAEQRGLGHSPTSILQRKKCFCIDENIACVSYASFQFAAFLQNPQPPYNKSDVQGLLAYRGYLNSFLSCSGLLKYSARYCERIFSVAIVLLIPVSSQNCSSWSLIVVASFMFRIFASFFCLGILVYSLKVVSLSPLNIILKFLMEFDVRLEY